MEQPAPVDHSWEDVKENARPLKTGYKLSALVQTPARREDLEAERAAFETEITACGGSDPLEPWQRYIAWAEQHALSGGIHVDRKQILERCAMQFRSFEQYQQDKRYLKVCLKYADCCDDPRDVFAFLEQQSIGTELHEFYMAWAFVLENSGQYAEAERVFETGKVKLTDDKAALLTAYQDQFRARAAEAKQRKLEGGDDAAQEPDHRAFGDVRHSKRGRVATNRAPARSRGGLKQAKAAPRQGNGGSLQVFCDPEGAESAGTGAIQVFSDMPTERITKKENTQAAGAWNEGGIKTKAKKVAPLNFAIHRDAEQEERPKAKAAPIANYRQTFERKALGNYKPPADVVSLKDFARERGIQSRKVEGGVLGYDPVPLFATDEEFCFEEIRGRAWLANPVRIEDAGENELDVEMDGCSPAVDPENRPTSAIPATSVTDVSVTEHTITKRLVFGQSFAAASTPYGAEHDVDDAEEPARKRSAPSPELVEPAAEAESPVTRNAPSPTINTKEAFAEVMAMFGAPQPAAPAPEQAAPAPPAPRPTAAPFAVFSDENAAPPVATAAAPAAGSFAVFSDENDENAPAPVFAVFRDEDAGEQENVAPAAYSVPTVTAAQEAADAHDSDRAVLQSVPGIPTGEAPASTTFEGLMQNLGVPLSKIAQDEPPHGSEKPKAETDFTVFEDPPTESTATLQQIDPSFVHSTPFPATDAAMEEEAPSFVGKGLSPILETSKESSMAASMTSSVLAPNVSVLSQPGEPSGAPVEMTSNSSHCQWPLEPAAQASALASVDFAALPGCNDLRTTGAPVISSESDPLTMAGINEAVHISGDAVAIGEASVFNAVAGGSMDSDDMASDDEDEDSGSGAPLQLKVSPSGCPWEFFILNELSNYLGQQSTKSAVKRSLPSVLSFAMYSDVHILAVEHVDDHTLQDVLDMQGKQGKSMDEPMVMFYTIEMLRVLEAIHSANIVHGSFEPSNLVLRNQPNGGSWDAMYNASGKGGWSSKGLFVTGFHNSISMAAMPGTRFAARPGHWKGMAEYPSFTFEVDYHGLVAVVHQLLHGAPLVLVNQDDAWTAEKPLKAWWQTQLWGELFDALLNASEDAPALLGELRRGFESYLAQNPYKAKSLKAGLMKQDVLLFKS